MKAEKQAKLNAIQQKVLKTCKQFSFWKSTIVQYSLTDKATCYSTERRVHVSNSWPCDRNSTKQHHVYIPLPPPDGEFIFFDRSLTQQISEKFWEVIKFWCKKYALFGIDKKEILD